MLLPIDKTTPLETETETQKHMLALFGQRMVVEFGLFRFMTLEDSFSIAQTCRAARYLRPRPLALTVKTLAQLRGVWPLLGLVKTLCLKINDGDSNSSAESPWPASLRELQSSHDLGPRPPMNLQLLLLHVWPRDFETTMNNLQQLHTLRFASVRTISPKQLTVIARACPGLKRFACYSISMEHPELQLEALSVVEADRLPDMPSLKCLRIRKLDYLSPTEAVLAFGRLPMLERLDLRAKGRNSIVLASNLAQLSRLESLSLENYRVVWDHELPGGLLSLRLLGVGMVPVERLRGLTKLQSAVLANEYGCALVLPPSLADLTLFQVGELFGPLRLVDLATFKRLDLNVWGLDNERLDDRTNKRRAREWESLCARLSLNELALSWPALRTMGNRVGPEFRTLLSRQRRLKLGWTPEHAEFVSAIVAATGPQLRQHVITGPCDVRLPERLLVGLEFLEIAGKVLFPGPTMTPPENFLRVQADKLFGHE